MEKLSTFLVICVFVKAVEERHHPMSVRAVVNGQMRVQCEININGKPYFQPPLVVGPKCEVPKKVFYDLGHVLPRGTHDEIYPKAVWIKQCLGVCKVTGMDSKCMPTETVMRQIPMKIVNTKTREESCAPYTIEEHVSCTCFQKVPCNSSMDNERDSLTKEAKCGEPKEIWRDLGHVHREPDEESYPKAVMVKRCIGVCDEGTDFKCMPSDKVWRRINMRIVNTKTGNEICTHTNLEEHVSCSCCRGSPESCKADANKCRTCLPKEQFQQQHSHSSKCTCDAQNRIAPQERSAGSNRGEF